MYKNKWSTVENSTTLYFNGGQLKCKGAFVFEKNPLNELVQINIHLPGPVL